MTSVWELFLSISLLGNSIWELYLSISSIGELYLKVIVALSGGHTDGVSRLHESIGTTPLPLVKRKTPCNCLEPQVATFFSHFIHY